MDRSGMLRRIRARESIEAECKGSIEEKIDRYLEIEHQEIIGGHYFAAASSECLHLYRDGYFIGAVMMSHEINEGIIKFVSERNSIERANKKGSTKTIEDLINELKEKNIISEACGDASMHIWKSYRNDIHHMNPTIAEINFKMLAKKNLLSLTRIEKEIFRVQYKNGAIIPAQPRYWDIRGDGTTQVYLRID